MSRMPSLAPSEILRCRPRGTGRPASRRIAIVLIAALLVTALGASGAEAAGGAIFRPLEWSAQLRQVVLLIALGGLAFSLRSL